MTRAQAEALLAYIDARIGYALTCHEIGLHPEGGDGVLAVEREAERHARAAFLATVDPEP